MKLDGKEIAKANMARRAENDKLKEEPEAVMKEGLESGSHIKEMMSLIESIHMKDPETAHKHMLSYASAAAKKP